MRHTLSLILMTLLIVISQVYADEYTLGIEDVMSVSLWEQPDLNSTVTVGPDGTIVLPQPIGIIRAEGDTTAQISDAIRERLSPYILGELHITVQVTQYKSRKIVILGAVGSPGVYAYAKIPPLPEILVQAGGLRPDADLTQVKLFSADNKTPTQTINLQQLFNDSYPLWPKLAPGDTLWIPAKPPLEQARVGDSTAGASSPLNQTPDLTPQASPQNTNKILIHVLGKRVGTSRRSSESLKTGQSHSRKWNQLDSKHGGVYCHGGCHTAATASVSRSGLHIGRRPATAKSRHTPRGRWFTRKLSHPAVNESFGLLSDGGRADSRRRC
ncbi:polysaccharide export protein [Candidatus Poribacteria bacterium]|nr:polysaccharide export protein [Candidatus Poribacteria bacterium]